MKLQTVAQVVHGEVECACGLKIETMQQESWASYHRFLTTFMERHLDGPPHTEDHPTPFDGLDSQTLTGEERAQINLTVELTNRFCALERHHPSDKQEFATAIHQLQRLIMVRPTRRTHPEIFPPGRA